MTKNQPPASDEPKAEKKKTKRTRPHKSKEMQDKLVEGLVKGQTQKEAGLAAGYTDEGNISRAVKRARRRFSEVLDSIGYDDTLAATKMVEMADRKKTEFFSDKGVVIEEHEVEDNVGSSRRADSWPSAMEQRQT